MRCDSIASVNKRSSSSLKKFVRVFSRIIRDFIRKVRLYFMKNKLCYQSIKKVRIHIGSHILKYKFQFLSCNFIRLLYNLL